MKKELAREQHALDKVTCEAGATWFEWKSAWLNPPSCLLKNLEFRRSFLHFGFKLRTATQIEKMDRIEFYLDIADRYWDIDLFAPIAPSGFNDGLERYTVIGHIHKDKIKWNLACQAFKFLCEGFFNGKDYASRLHALELSITPELFPKMLWFFRRSLKYPEYSNIKPAQSSHTAFEISTHYLETAQGFAKAFCSWAWDFRFHKQDKGSQSTHERLRKHLFDVIDLMSHMGCLHYLITPDQECDQKTYDLLVDHVLKQKFLFPVKAGGPMVERSPMNIDEAAAIGEELSSVLLVVRSRLQFRGTIATK